MHGDIILVCLESNIELLPISDDIGSDEKVSRPDIVLFEERVKVIGWLCKHAKMGESELKWRYKRNRRMTRWKRAVVERDTHDALGRVIDVTGIATTVCARANLGTSGVDTRIVIRSGVRSGLCGGCDVGDFSSLNGVVERVFPSLGHCIRIRSTSRVCGGPGRGTYLWEAGGRRSLTPKEGMNGVIVLMIPTTWKRASRDVIMVIVMKRDGGTVDGGGKREKEEEGTSKGGEHCAGRERVRAREP
jgi:hypothetical protein